MLFITTIFFLCVMITASTTTGAQQDASSMAISVDTIPSIRVLDINPRFLRGIDTVWQYSGICKALKVSKYAKQNNSSGSKSVITAHGNISYDFLYRSLSDTPFFQKDFRQHSVRTNFSLLFKNVYPVQVTIQHRNSNSPYFRDITDVSLQYSHKDYLRHLKDNLHQQIVRTMTAEYLPNLKQAELRNKAKLDEVAALEQWLASPARLHELIAERERILRRLPQNPADSLPGRPDLQLPTNGLPGMPQLPDEEAIKKAISDKLNHRLSATGDSVLARLEAWMVEKRKRISDSLLNMQTANFIEKKKKELADAKKALTEYEKKLKSMKKNVADSLLKIKQELIQLKDPAAFKDFVKQKKINAKELPKGWKALTAVRSIGIGRSWVDYSELTVKNISLTGGNIEINPGNFYFAAAVGRINYRFRDFVVQNNAQPKQSLYLLRAGIGKKDGNNFILSWYDGKRNLLNPFTSTGNTISLERVIGMSAETRFQINDNHYIIAEFGKSSYHNTSNANADGGTLFDRAKNFKDRSNEAYSIKVSSYWPDAGTKITGYYKKMGEHFQSFNLQPVNSLQEAFQVKLQQQLWKKKLTIDAGIRKNDFSNPFITPGLSSRTVFKSLQLSLRIPKYPYITIGYAPSSQLTVLDNQRLIENHYNTLNAVLSYPYRAKKVNMLTNAMFLKFYNSTPDTGFIYYNASSFSLNQFFYIGKWQLQSGLTITDQEDLRVLTIEQSTSYELKHWLSLTGGLKYNRVSNSSTHWGSVVGINMAISRIGTVQMSYDKSYLPGINRNLLPVQTGRVSLYRSF